jgi:hypothetical protein
MDIDLEGKPKKELRSFSLQYHTRIISMVLVVTGLLAAVMASMYFWEAGQLAKIPAELVRVQSVVSFPLYYASSLPPGMKLDTKSVTATSGVVLFSYTYDTNKRLSVSIQAKAKDFDTSSFKPTSDFTTHIGRAYVVDLEDRSAAAVVSDKSWVLLNAPEKISADILRQFIDALTPVK